MQLSNMGKMPKCCTVWAVVLALCMNPATSFAEPTRDGWQPGLHDMSSMALLAGAQDAFSQLELEQTPFQRTIYLTSALSSLSALYQLHGFEWAMERLLPLYSDPDCPDIHFGYSADGRVRLTVEPMELRNPAFNEFTVMMVTIESNCGDILTAESFGPLKVELTDGLAISPDQLSPGHELWERIERLADTFYPPPVIHPGNSTAFKQVFAVQGLSSEQVLAVSLEWDGYFISVPYYDNLLAKQELE